jgi:hypothetical protein
MKAPQPVGDRARCRQTPPGREKLANLRQNSQVIGFDRHRLVEFCHRFFVSTSEGKRLRVTRNIAGVVGEKLIGPARKLQFLLRRTRPQRERGVILRRAVPHFQRLAFERRPVERSLRRFDDRALEEPDFGKKTRDRMAAIGQPDVADLEAVAVELHMAAVAIRGVVEDIGGRDEALERKAALDFKVQPARVGVPPVLERNETGIDRELRRERIKATVKSMASI